MENFIIVQIIENLLEDSVKNNAGQDGTILEEVLVNSVKATMTVVIWMWWKNAVAGKVLWHKMVKLPGISYL